MSVTAIEKFLRHSSFFFFRKPYPETLKTIKSWGFRYKFTNIEQLKKVIFQTVIKMKEKCNSFFQSFKHLEIKVIP